MLPTRLFTPRPFTGHGSLFPIGRCQNPCDASTAMGPCCNIRCHNAAQAWQLGWMAPSPKTIVHGAIFPPATTLTFFVSAMTSSFPDHSSSMVVVYPDWLRKFGMPWVLFISYRQVPYIYRYVNPICSIHGAASCLFLATCVLRQF